MVDVLGMKLDGALKLLSTKAIAWDVKLTSPPNGREASGPLRVIQRDWDGNRSILTVCKVPDIFQGEQ